MKTSEQNQLNSFAPFQRDKFELNSLHYAIQQHNVQEVYQIVDEFSNYCTNEKEKLGIARAELVQMKAVILFEYIRQCILLKSGGREREMLSRLLNECFQDLGSLSGVELMKLFPVSTLDQLLMLICLAAKLQKNELLKVFLQSNICRITMGLNLSTSIVESILLPDSCWITAERTALLQKTFTLMQSALRLIQVYCEKAIGVSVKKRWDAWTVRKELSLPSNLHRKSYYTCSYCGTWLTLSWKLQKVSWKLNSVLYKALSTKLSTEEIAFAARVYPIDNCWSLCANLGYVDCLRIILLQSSKSQYAVKPCEWGDGPTEVVNGKCFVIRDALFYSNPVICCIFGYDASSSDGELNPAASRSRTDYYRCIELLVDCFGTDILNCADRLGASPLLIACQLRNFELIKFLIALGADPSAGISWDHSISQAATLEQSKRSLQHCTNLVRIIRHSPTDTPVNVSNIQRWCTLQIGTLEVRYSSLLIRSFLQS